MPRQLPDAFRDAFTAQVGAEIRALREAGGLSQQAVAELFDWRRDAISKIETGRNMLSLYDYLLLMRFLREIAPDHPAQALANRLLPKRRTRA